MHQRHAVGALALASLLGLTAQFLFFHQPLGLNVPLVTGSFLAATWTQRDPKAPFRGRDAWLPAGSLAFAAFCAVRTDASLLAFDVLATPTSIANGRAARCRRGVMDSVTDARARADSECRCAA